MSSSTSVANSDQTDFYVRIARPEDEKTSGYYKGFFFSLAPGSRATAGTEETAQLMQSIRTFIGEELELRANRFRSMLPKKQMLKKKTRTTTMERAITIMLPTQSEGWIIRANPES